MKKAFVCNICMLNWYRYSVYQVFDDKGETYFVAEPQQIGGATKCADTLAELKGILMLDATIRQKTLQKTK